MATAFRSRAYYLLPAGLMLLVGALGIQRPGLWADELATWGAVRLSWPDLFGLLSDTDAVNGPYYTVMKLWTTVAGHGEVALRVPSLLAMACAAAATARLAARLWTPTVGMTAGMIFAVLPSTSRYAQEARAYAFVVALAVIATLLLVTAEDRPGSRSWIGYTVTMVAMAAGNLVSLLLLPAHGLLIVWRRRRLSRGWLWTVGAICAVTAPLAWWGSRQISQTSWIDPVSLSGLATAPETLWGAGATVLPMGGLIAVGLLWRWDRDAWLIAALAGVPALGLLLVSLVVDLWWPRYLLYVVPFTAILAALAVRPPARPPAPWVLSLVAVSVVAASGILAHWDIRRDSGHSHDTRAVAGIISAGHRPGDGLAVALDEPVVPWEARDLVARYVPAESRPTDTFAVDRQRENGQLAAQECRDPSSCLGDTTRLWVIRFEHPEDVLEGMGGGPKERLLREEFDVTEIWRVRGMTVALLTRD